MNAEERFEAAHQAGARELEGCGALTPGVLRMYLRVAAPILLDGETAIPRREAIEIALVTDAPREEWPAPDRMKLHGVWYIPDPNQADAP